MSHAPPLLDPRLSQLAARWFLCSGIQEPQGGVARYYRSDVARNAPVSTEITGYAVSALVFLYQRYQDPQCLDAATRAADFLTQRAWIPSLGTFPFEGTRESDTSTLLSYFFDCGIIIRGLLALERIVNSDRYLDIAVAAGESMWRDFVDKDVIHPILSLPEKTPLPGTAQWSRQPGCYQLKSALAWHDLARVTGERKFDEYYRVATNAAIANKGHFLPAETREKTVDRLHSYCYFLEALLSGANSEDFRSVVSEGIARVSEYLRDIRPEFERSDVYAQVLRIRLLAASSLGLSLNNREAAEEAAAIEGFQINQPSHGHAGGFWFGRKQGQMLPFINPVSTAFCLQAHEWWQDHLSGKPIQQAVI